jgi:hypothetical protein
MENQFGSFGTGESEFLLPKTIASRQNRIFVYDESREDIQVFDCMFRYICSLRYNENPEYHNYIEPDFLLHISDISVITKEEGSRLFYYALLLNKTKTKLAMIRLPQWEELRAKARNNKIVFMQDGEVFTAKPEGSDLSKLLSSDSLPIIEGTLDYPALSPDGKTLVCTSKQRLYTGSPDTVGPANDYFYMQMYTVDIETNTISRLNLGLYDRYEIERPVFNSNGTEVIFSARSATGKWQLYIYNMKTKETRPLFSQPTNENARFPYYSPDDRFIVFVTDYDGDEEIEIVDTLNTNKRIVVTSNRVSDSYPVWSSTYPFEISNLDYKIDSKIAFVSNRNAHRGIYYIYLARRTEADIRIVTEHGEDVGYTPDRAAIEVTNETIEGNYPAFTGDGRNLIFEYFDIDVMNMLKKYDFEAKSISNMTLPGTARRPAGMKNMITNFTAENVNGNEIKLAWNRYTSFDEFYHVQYKKNREGEECVDKKVFNQTGVTMNEEFEMGQEYLVRVCIFENDEKVVSSQWKKVKIPEVVAKPSYRIDERNPYLVFLNAWKPNDETDWEYTWIIDNQEYKAQTSLEYPFEYATSGFKTVVLKAANRSNTAHDTTAMSFTIQSDIDPVIEYILKEETNDVVLSADNSKGNKIDLSSAEWRISGYTGDQKIYTGSPVSVNLDTYRHKIFVNLTLKRLPVNGQSNTDIIRKNTEIDLDMKEVKPIITYEANPADKRLIKFSGEESKGNIDWYRAKWQIFEDGAVVHSEEGTSSCVYLFPERNIETVYSVSLTIPRRGDGLSESVSLVISIEGAPLEPEIDYEILTLKEGENVAGAKIVFDCTKSKGSNIDFAATKWVVPFAADYKEESTQFGPTAVYNLSGIEKGIVIEVQLTMQRRGGMDPPKTITRLIKVMSGEIPREEIVIGKNIETSSTGKVLILDALKSTGPNIDWEKTAWLVDNQYSRTGPVVRIDIPASAESKTINFTCTIYRYGSSPQTITDYVIMGKAEIAPIISYARISETQKNVYELSVLSTKGINIDWEKTTWYFYDGVEKVIKEYGARVAHAFTLRSDLMGYPVMVEMFLKESGVPFVGYTSINVEGDELIPIIAYKAAGTDPNAITFSAEISKGSNIDLSQAKWTFGDSSESQYGPVVTHRYPVSGQNMSYRVSLTIMRKSIDTGLVETKTACKDINLAQDRVKPVMKAQLYSNGYLVLSAEDSLGQGLMLDRSIWLFEGAGDSTSYNINEKVGTVKSTTASIGGSVYGSVAVKGEVNLWFVKTEVTATVGASLDSHLSVNKTSYEGFKENTASFSSSNTHTGAVCRKYVKVYDTKTGTWKDLSNIYVTLFIYRVTGAGAIEGESITVNIGLNDAKLKTQGVRYE